MVPPCTERGDDDDAMVPLAPKPFNSKEFKLEEYPVLKRAIERWNVINEPKEANAGCALLKRIQDCAVGSGRCEMPRRENGKVTLTAGQVRAALCHAILCNATDPVGEQRWGSEVTKPANRSAGKEYGQSGGLVWNKFLGKTDVDGDGNKPNVDGDGKKPNVSPMAVQRALALLAYFEAATKENFDDKRRISFTLHEGDASLLTTLHNPPTQIKFPEVSVHHGDIDKETVLGSRKDSACVNFANYVYGYGELSQSKNGVHGGSAAGTISRALGWHVLLWCVKGHSMHCDSRSPEVLRIRRHHGVLAIFSCYPTKRRKQDDSYYGCTEFQPLYPETSSRPRKRRSILQAVRTRAGETRLTKGNFNIPDPDREACVHRRLGLRPVQMQPLLEVSPAVPCSCSRKPHINVVFLLGQEC